jgi:hypothetical protein
MKSSMTTHQKFPRRRPAQIVLALFAGLFASLTLAALFNFALRSANADALNKLGINEQSRAGKLLKQIAPKAFNSTAAPTAPFAIYTVNSLDDTNTGSGTSGTLRYCITQANASSGADTINFSVNGTITLTSNLPNITDSLTINGNGTANTIINGNHLYRSLNSIQTDGITVTIQNLKATNGLGGTFGGTLDISSEGGLVMLNNVEFTNGHAGYGGGIRTSHATTIVSNSIIRDNTSDTVSAGIWSGHSGNLTLVNTLVTGNSGPGGGVFNNGTVLNIYNCTVVGNSASNPAYAAGVDSNGGTYTLYNSILANNTGGGGNCDNGSATTDIRNTLIEDGDCNITHGVNGNLTGDPALNSNFTLTSASIAVGSGNNSLIPSGVTTDLAGNARIQQGTVDMGAYESAFVGIVPALGNYPATTVSLGAQTTVTPDAAPTNATNLIATASSGFNGVFYANPVTGAVNVINAHPAGTYTITVTSIRPAGSASKTFTLTVQSGMACATPPLFSSAPDLSVGSPRAIAVGDFNNDGKQDLAILNGSSATVSIRLGDGAGNFNGTTTVSTGSTPNAVAVCDFNGDGNQDLAVANTANSVSIRFGDGAGNFSGTTNISISGGPKSIAVGDFNGDGKLDFLTANVNNDTVSVRFGNGAGVFTGTTNVSVGDGPGHIVVGDFDGDGDLDFAVSNQLDGTVSVRLNDGAGNFSGATEITVGTNPAFIALGDFNKDGKLDFVTSNQTSNTLSIRFGDGLGGFIGSTNLAISTAPSQVVVGDFNNDGNPDIAARKVLGIDYRLGDGMGGFGSPSSLTVTGNSAGYPMALGDFNQDGRQDLVTADFAAGTASIRLGGCNNPPNITAGGPLARQAGSPGSNSTIANVNDTETVAGSLVVTATTVPSGISITGINNNNGTVTATVAAACNATIGANTVVLTVTDGNGATATANLTVNVTANTAPTLAYSNVSVNGGASTTNSPTTVTDNGTINSYAVQSQGTYTGTISVNSSGVVSISNAAPIGNHTITIRATDNCGAFADASFTLTVNNTAPAFTPAAAISRQQGSPGGAAVTVGTVNDAQTAAGSLTVTQIAGGTATGITVSGITNTNGTITAVVAASCTATAGTVRFQVSDGSLTATGDLTVNVTANTAPTLAYSNVSVNGGASTTNSPTTATDNGSITAYSLQGVGSYTGGISVNSSGVVSINAAAPVGVHTITVRATDNCGTITEASFTINVGNNGPSITPAATLIRQRGTAASVSTIATVNDGETPAGNLVVTATTVPAGISISTITNNNGTVSANIAAACAAALGNNTIVLTVTDENGGTATGNLIVNVTDNTAPVLNYPNSNVALGTATSVNPTTATDNGTIAAYQIVSVTPPMTTTPAVNASGVVSVTNAGPFGSHTIVVSATDNCGATTEASFTLNVGCGTISVNPSTLNNGLTFVAYSAVLSATGGSGAYNFTLHSGSLPAGLNLVGNTITGTPITAGASTFTIRATDDNSCFGDRQYTLLIGSTGLMYYPLARPVRLLDTRPGASPNACHQPNAPIQGGTSRLQPGRGVCEGLTIPANATTLTGNITTVNSGGGYLTVYPSDAPQPLVANSNYQPNEILNNAFTVGLGASDGAFKIFVTTNTDVVVDVTGYYAPPGAGGLYFHPLPKPIRLLETRNGFSGCQTTNTTLAAGSTRTQLGTLTCDGVTIPSDALALVGNATTVNPAGTGFLTMFPANAMQPFIASSNFTAGQVMNAPFTVGLSPSGEFKIFTMTTTDLVIDVMGYYSSQINDVNGEGLLFNSLGAPLRLLDTRAGESGCFTPQAPMIGGTTYTQMTQVPCTNLTPTARALVGNVTAVNVVGTGFLTFWPSNATQPTVATSNYTTGQIFNRHFTAGLAPDGSFKRYSHVTTDLVIDISGFFAP